MLKIWCIYFCLPSNVSEIHSNAISPSRASASKAASVLSATLATTAATLSVLSFCEAFNEILEFYLFLKTKNILLLLFYQLIGCKT